MATKLNYSFKAPFLILLYWLVACHTPSSEGKLLLFSIDFEQDSDLDHWKAEVQGSSSEVSIVEGALDIDASGGATIWFKEKLHVPIEIEYTALVVGKEGPNDRVSDLNCFWMATDPRCLNNIFSCADTTRTGLFRDYHQLKTYYVGYGGHNNTKTRFRRYIGNGERPLLPEHDLAAPHLIVPNQDIKIRIRAYSDRTTYSINDQVLYEYYDEEPYLEGWFAFRTVRNHLQIKDFRVRRLPD